MKRELKISAAFVLTILSAHVYADADTGKLLATGGVSQVEGSGGGGLVPWALITGYGTKDSYGANVHYTGVGTQDYSLLSAGVAAGFADRVEVSFDSQDFRGTAAALKGVDIKQNIVGLKVRVAGDAVYDQDRLMPQIAIGIQAKQNQGISGLGTVTNVTQLGAKSDSGVDYYVAGTKILLDQSLLLNATLRLTKANQMGLLGFGGDKSNSYQAEPEISAAYLLSSHVALGAEYRKNPNDLTLANQKDYSDLFVSYFVNKNISVTAAYASLGTITTLNNQSQRGYYVSLQSGF